MSSEIDNQEQAGATSSRQSGQRLSPAEIRAEIGQRVSDAYAVRDRRSATRSPRPAKAKTRGIFARLFTKAPREPVEAHRNCCIVGVLMLLDRSLALDGLILEVGRGSLLFRQGASFIFDRTGAEISIRFGEFDKRGRIVKVSPRGYFIELLEPLTDADVDRLLNAHGLPA